MIMACTNHPLCDGNHPTDSLIWKRSHLVFIAFHESQHAFESPGNSDLGPWTGVPITGSQSWDREVSTLPMWKVSTRPCEGTCEVS